MQRFPDLAVIPTVYSAATAQWLGETPSLQHLSELQRSYFDHLCWLAAEKPDLRKWLNWKEKASSKLNNNGTISKPHEVVKDASHDSRGFLWWLRLLNCPFLTSLRVLLVHYIFDCILRWLFLHCIQNNNCIFFVSSQIYSMRLAFYFLRCDSLLHTRVTFLAYTSEQGSKVVSWVRPQCSAPHRKITYCRDC